MSLFAAKTCTHCACDHDDSAAATEHTAGAHDTMHDHEMGGHSHAHGAEDDSGGHRRELALLAACALFFFTVMGFSGRIEAAFGAWALYCLYAVPYLLCGVSIYRAAWEGLKKGDYLNEFTLMCGATIAAIVLGELPEAVGVMLFYRIGEFFQDLAASGSRRSIKQLLASKPSTAHVFVDEEWRDLPVEQVEVGQRVQVRAGEKIPLDGTVLEGESQVDQSPLTGEPVPVVVRQGADVQAGTINLTGLLTLEVRGLFHESQVARILQLVESAAKNKSPTERFITRFARYYTPAVVFLAVLTALLPPLLITGADFHTWIYRALVLLVISCPCALIISIPLSYFGGIGAASRKGILVKGGTVLDGLLHVDTVVFDKTGTLTKGVFDVMEIVPSQNVEKQELLAAAVMAESSSNHPIARSILACARAQGLSAAPSGSGQLTATEIAGKGVEVFFEGVRYLAGTETLMSDKGIGVPSVHGQTGALVHIARDDRYLGHILISDAVRPESAEAVQYLRDKGFRTYMLTGDRTEAAAWVADAIGLDGYEAGLLPEGKVTAMRRLSGDRGEAARTAFVGDGINDAPILALSHVGIAMGGVGTEAAIEAADAVILNDSPAQVPVLFQLARDVRAVVWQNISLALGVKAAFMILGVSGISGLWEAVFADVGVALLAVLNASRLVRK